MPRLPLLISLSLCLATPLAYADFDLDKLNLPDGFQIEIFADNIPDARAMALGENGTLFVGSRKAGTVTAIMDTNADGKPDRNVSIASGLSMPAGIALVEGDLYVAAHNQILRYPDIEQSLPAIPSPEILTDDLPSDRSHGWKHINVGPDNRLYFGIGAPGNIVEERLPYATLHAIDVESGEMELIAEGVRNSIGLDWNPETGKIWFTDNGRDLMGDDLPPCEINVLTEVGQHFGYPYIHGSDIADPEFGDAVDLATFDFEKPVLNLGAHVAPLGIEFYNGDMFPEEYKRVVFWAEHGSWNRSSKVGYRVMMATYEGDRVVSNQPFIDGWLQPEEEVLGRPVDFLELEDGSLLVSDDFAGVVYRVTYSAE